MGQNGTCVLTHGILVILTAMCFIHFPHRDVPDQCCEDVYQLSWEARCGLAAAAPATLGHWPRGMAVWHSGQVPTKRASGDRVHRL